MELDDLQNSWTLNERKLSEAVTINKRVLKAILMEKPVKTINVMRYRSVFGLSASMIVIVLFFARVDLRDQGIALYSGLGLISIAIILSLKAQIEYIRLLSSIDMSAPVLKIRKVTNRIITNRLKNTQSKYLLGIICVLGILAAVNVDPRFISAKVVLPISIVVAVYLGKSLIDQKQVNKKLEELDKQLIELEELES